MFKENSICISIGGKISFWYCNVVMIDGNHDNCYVHCVQGSTTFHILWPKDCSRLCRHVMSDLSNTVVGLI